MLLEVNTITVTDLKLVMFGSMIIYLIPIAGVRFKAISMGRLQRIEAALLFLYLHLVTESRSALFLTMEQRTMPATYVSSI